MRRSGNELVFSVAHLIRFTMGIRRSPKRSEYALLWIGLFLCQQQCRPISLDVLFPLRKIAFRWYAWHSKTNPIFVFRA